MAGNPRQNAGAPVAIGHILSHESDEDLSREMPCRQCGDPVLVTPAGWHAFKAASRALMARGEKPLRDDEPFYCDACVTKRWKARALFVTERAQKCRDAVVRLKAGGLAPDVERELERVVMRLHEHPEKCLRAIRERFERAATGPKWRQR